MQGASLCTSASPWIGQDLVRKLALLTLPAAQLVTLLPKLAGLLVPSTTSPSYTSLLPASATRVVREPARQSKKEGECKEKGRQENDTMVHPSLASHRGPTRPHPVPALCAILAGPMRAVPILARLPSSLSPPPHGELSAAPSSILLG
jgi:hypothetical protein